MDIKYEGEVEHLRIFELMWVFIIFSYKLLGRVTEKKDREGYNTDYSEKRGSQAIQSYIWDFNVAYMEEG